MRHSVGIRELRDGLSRWIEKVKAGDEVVVTDHGRPVAVVSRPGAALPARTEEEHLDGLAGRGLLRRGRGWKPVDPAPIPGFDLPRAIVEDREDRL